MTVIQFPGSRKPSAPKLNPDLPTPHQAHVEAVAAVRNAIAKELRALSDDEFAEAYRALSDESDTRFFNPADQLTLSLYKRQRRERPALKDANLSRFDEFHLFVERAFDDVDEIPF